jgi:hypothetical protein
MVCFYYKYAHARWLDTQLCNIYLFTLLIYSLLFFIRHGLGLLVCSNSGITSEIMNLKDS